MLQEFDPNNLPLLDLSGFAFRPPTDDEPFCVLEVESEEEDAALGKLLGVPKLIEELSQIAKERGPGRKQTLQVFARLAPIGITVNGEIVAVALQLAVGPKKVQDGTWVGFFVEPEHYDELSACVQQKVEEYRDFLEQTVGRPSGLN
jgi:hypothetical protein